MNNTLTPWVHKDPVSSLIDELHGVLARLEEQTGGELDSVTDGHGRMFLLQNAQVALRLREITRQAAILNALTEQIALLDNDGVVLSVNAAWHRFVQGNAMATNGFAVGENYFAMCAATTGTAAALARTFSDGIRAVLRREIAEFSIDYHHDSPTGRCWFTLQVMPLSGDHSDGVVLVNANVSEKKRHELSLLRFGTAMNASQDAIYMIDFESWRVIHVNDAACHLDGRSRAALLASAPEDIFATPRDVMIRFYTQLVTDKRAFAPIEFVRRSDKRSPLWLEIRVHAEQSPTGSTIVVLARDITDRKLAEKRLYRLAHFDGLTGLPNRMLYKSSLKRTLALATVHGWQVAVMFIDVDCFKNINDTMGHAVGDELLCQFTTRLRACVRARDTVGRLGGDEFALILAKQEGGRGAEQVALQIKQALRPPFFLNKTRVFITASIGITLFPTDAADPDSLLKYADTAMYQAKLAGRDTFRFFKGKMNQEAMARLALKNGLREAINNDEFVLHYQPKINLGNRQVSGVEALLRWNRPGHGLVPPGDFMQVLEETGLVVEVGRWVIAQICAQIALWMNSPTGSVAVAINICGRQFFELDFETDVTDALRKFAVPPSLLELELTESALMENTSHTVDTLRKLRSLGVRISIDDFGTGFSSLAYLRHFPLDKLKIDIAFIRNIATNADDAAIVLSIIGIAHSLHLRAVAEGVETVAQLDFLRKHDCDEVQGFYFSPPLPAADLVLFLHQHPHQQ